MPTLAEIRQQYPQYEDMSDADLARALHGKFYADMSPNDFNARIGYEPDKATDIAKSGASGVARGTADLLGMPGTIGDLAQGGMQWLMRQGYGAVTGEEPDPRSASGVERFFAGPTPEVEASLIGGGSNPLSGASLRAGLSSVTGGATDYQPLTTEGEFARTGGEFLPAALTGPGGLIRKSAMATIPAASSEAAGQATRGTAFEPYARAGAAIAAGIPTAGMANPVKVAAKGAPTREALKDQTNRLYKGLRDAGIRYDADTFASTVQSARDELLKKGLRPVGPTKEAFDYLDELQKGVGMSPSFDDINSAVQAVGRSARSTQDGNAKLAFNVIRDKLDDLESAAPLTTTQPISQNTINKARSTARNLAKRNIKQRALDEIMENAETYRSGTEAGIRNGIGNLLRSKRGKQLFSDAERTALLRVANGRKPLEQLSKFGFDLTSGSGNAAFLPTLAGGGAYMAAGPMGALLPAAGTAAKIASPRLTNRAMEQAGAAIRSGGLLGPSGERAAGLLADQSIRRLLLGPMAVSAIQTPER